MRIAHLRHLRLAAQATLFGYANVFVCATDAMQFVILDLRVIPEPAAI